jgi:hypothetical protein
VWVRARARFGIKVQVVGDLGIYSREGRGDI